MFVTLVAVIVALVLGHVAQPLGAAVRQYGWYAQWVAWLNAQFPEGGFWRGRFGLIVALAPPLAVAGLFQLALDAPYVGIVGLLFGIAVLFYCWGPRDLDLDVDAVVDAPDPASRREAAAKLWPPGGVVSLEAPALVGAVFDSARRRWFGVLFWFLLLGPFGAVLYRFTALAGEGETAARLPHDTAAGARWLLDLLDWPVAQLMTLAMALVGNFDTVFAAWKDNGGAGFDFGADFLAAAGRASVRSDLADEAQDYVEDGIATAGALSVQMGELPELRDAMGLVWRTLLLWLVVLALFVLAGWVT